MTDPITEQPITADELVQELKKIQKQIDASKTEEVEIVFMQLKGKRTEMLKEILNGHRRLGSL